jgi:cell wall-associated NlpC family hydrolase
MRYIALATAYSLLSFSEVQGDDTPLGTIYRSLDKWSRNVRQQLEEEATPTPARKRTRHHSSDPQHHVSPSPSPKAKAKEEETEEKPKAKKTREEDTEEPSSKRAEDRTKAEESKPEPTPETTPNARNPSVAVASLDASQLKDFDSQPQRVQDLIRSALALTQRNLAYTYGSADPANGGMDCSGFIYYVLSNAGFKDVPRQSSDQYLWVRKNGNFHAVLSRNANTFELEQLRPGDLMFWSGTYKVDRDVPITHVMIYLGKQKGTGKPVMVGASDGRSYNGERRFGVSVFDFKLPNGTPNKNDLELVARFEGYSAIPGLREEVYTVQAATPAPASPLRSRTPQAERTPFLKEPRPMSTPRKPLSNGD